MEQYSDIQRINADIESCLSSEEIDVSALRALIHQRENIIKAHLANLNKAQARCFAQNEITFQSSLQERVSALLASAKNDLSLSITARKVAAKYK